MGVGEGRRSDQMENWQPGVEATSIQPQLLHANLLPVKHGKRNLHNSCTQVAQRKI